MFCNYKYFPNKDMGSIQYAQNRMLLSFQILDKEIKYFLNLYNIEIFK